MMASILHVFVVEPELIESEKPLDGNIGVTDGIIS